MSSTSPPSRVRRLVAAVAGAGLVAVMVPPAHADPAPGQESRSQERWTATPLTGGEPMRGARSETGRLARSDQALLRSTSEAAVNVMVKLDYDSYAAYRGGLDGLPATSPAETGRALDVRGAEARRYTGHIERVEDAFLTALAKQVPGARAGQRLRTVYGGIALRIPAGKAALVARLPGVAAVQEDRPERLLTDSSASFIGAPTVYGRLGGASSAGRGVVVGVLDSGAWPEHPQFADPGTLPAVPPTKDGTPRVCAFGDNPLTPQADPFACDRKLIGGAAFLDTYNSSYPGEKYPDSARDSNGHGTHTATTAAGGPVADATLLGISRGPLHGVAPAAHVSVYKVCGQQGCFPSDAAQAVGRAILDGVQVINYSVSGGASPYSDPVELAFLDAYAAGVFVAASAGNSGPKAGTVNHVGPWVTTVAASTQSRTFQSAITLAGAGGASTTLRGQSVTTGVASPLPVVLASAPPYSNAGCSAPAPAGLFTGKIVACESAGDRIAKGHNVRRGGAAGLILYDARALDAMADNHWLPAIHLGRPEADTMLAFLSANPGATATFTEGAKATGQGDVMTSFSSRGPGGDFLKPDVSAPGLHILAGQTPVLESPAGGPPGNLYQVMAGSSMAAPHVAGAAALLFALHPGWTPGQVKSALSTTARTSVTKQDRLTPADPFDVGAGRIDLTRAGDPGLTLSESASNFAAAAADEPNRADLNLPSVNAPVMPGVLTVRRTVTNVTNRTLLYRATGTTVSGASVTVLPPLLTVAPGKSAKLSVVIAAPELPDGQYFGRVDLKEIGGSRDLHLPVAFFRRQGAVPVEQNCAPSDIRRGVDEAVCTVTVRNDTFAKAEVTAVSTLDGRLRLNGVSGATTIGTQIATARATLSARQPDRPGVAPGTGPAPYVPLDALGVRPTPIGDEQALNFTVPAFTYAGRTYTRLGVVSNGYTVAGGTSDPADISPTPQALPDPAAPDNVLAPYWTDLDGTDAPGVYVGTLADGPNRWLVVEWRLKVRGTSDTKVFQQWIGLNGTEDITYTYDPNRLPGSPPGDLGLTVGAENADGTAGGRLPGPPTGDLRVTSAPGAPGGSLTYTVKVKGATPGIGTVTTGTSTPQVKGLTVEVGKVTVR
ncbi:S8 family serine peptidase [Streptosporangium saharense]|uniref:S8 family serine peptidase n=1 Tax=Streptosporangium saharense TaxID=1706840 RepID=UPI003332868B